jgi:hypothetical protein
MQWRYMKIDINTNATTMACWCGPARLRRLPR